MDKKLENILISQSKTMQELILCFTQQNLNEIPWCISLEEYLKLTKLKSIIQTKETKVVDLESSEVKQLIKKVKETK